MNPACVRCYEAKVRCDREFPCRRCIQHSYECMPHLTKKQQSINVTESFIDPKRLEFMLAGLRQNTSRHPSGVRRVLNLMYARCQKMENQNPMWSKTLAMAITVAGMERHEIEVPKPQAQAHEELSDFESWVHPSLLELRKKRQLPGVATTFYCTVQGEQFYEFNEKMREQFIADLDDVDKDLIGRDVPDLTHRIVAVSDRTQFIKDMFDGLMTSTSEEPHVLHTSETLAQLVDKQGTNVLGFVHRTTWFDLTCNGSRMAYFMTIKVMPKSRHFITPQRMLSVATRAKKKRKTSANKQDIGPCRVVAAAAPALAAFQPEQQARFVSRCLESCLDGAHCPEWWRGADARSCHMCHRCKSPQTQARQQSTRVRGCCQMEQNCHRCFLRCSGARRAPIRCLRTWRAAVCLICSQLISIDDISSIDLFI
eukprot:TRINITY_DN2572_c0_g1_i7.p1 TRINITY_DN2572_c0_g1~~TRINITY_DN2572_c0_g1_i7.p1  ORF type:complete len:425 (+),score=34.21 TRINITY_DN2572_c0_g1_i7:191-1465(+)